MSLTGGPDLTTCPCGGPGAYAVCCRPLHDRESRADTAEVLMRSRYAAYAVGRDDHLVRTWHPRTRPLAVTADPATRWTGLRVIQTDAGGPDGDEGWVTFEASWRTACATGVLRERSLFERRRGSWVYVADDPEPA